MWESRRLFQGCGNPRFLWISIAHHHRPLVCFLGSFSFFVILTEFRKSFGQDCVRDDKSELDYLVARYHAGSLEEGGSLVCLMDRPFSSNARLEEASKMSACGSPMTPCQSATGSWLAIDGGAFAPSFDSRRGIAYVDGQQIGLGQPCQNRA